MDIHIIDRFLRLDWIMIFCKAGLGNVELAGKDKIQKCIHVHTILCAYCAAYHSQYCMHTKVGMGSKILLLQRFGVLGS
jgi:hypothetical protein